MEFIADFTCQDLEAVCEEVKRGLREGNKVLVEYFNEAEPFLVTHYVDKVRVRGERRSQKVSGYKGD